VNLVHLYPASDLLYYIPGLSICFLRTKFDLQATIRADAGQLSRWISFVVCRPAPGPALAIGPLTETKCSTLCSTIDRRASSCRPELAASDHRPRPGRHSAPDTPSRSSQLIYRRKAYESHAKDYEFSRATMLEHWASGLAAVNRSLEKRHAIMKPRPDISFQAFDEDDHTKVATCEPFSSTMNRRQADPGQGDLENDPRGDSRRGRRCRCSARAIRQALTFSFGGNTSSSPTKPNRRPCRAALPEPLEPAPGNLAYFEWMKMPDASGFGDYEESRRPASPLSSRDSPATSRFRCTWTTSRRSRAAARSGGFPKKYGVPRLKVVKDT